MPDPSPTARSLLLQRLLDGAITHAIIGQDLEGRITAWSRGAEALFGWSEAEAVGQDGAITFTPADRAAGAPQDERGRALRDGKAEDVRWHIRKDGTQFWSNGIMTPLADGAGTVKIMRDWTEQHRIEQALKASEERLRGIIESATEYAIFTLDAAGHVTSWNIGAERILGYTSEEIVGRDCRLLFTPEQRQAQEPEREMADALRLGRAHVEREHLHRNGRRLWSSQTLMPLRGVRGHRPSFLKILRDRTEEKRVEDALRSSEARFRTLTETIPQLVWRSWDDGQWIVGGPQWQAFTGQSEAATRGRGWLQAVHPDDRALTMAAWSRAVETGALSVEHRIRKVPEGEYRWFQTRAVPLRDDQDAASEWFGTSTDVHDLKRLQERQGVLLAELQHRTRNLLAIVSTVARQTLKVTGNSLTEFKNRFNNRLQALGRVQGVLSRGDDQAITLADIVRMEIAAHGSDPDGGRVQITGPRVDLPHEAVQTLTLALHELATNALKYGALSAPAGRLRVGWTVAPAELPAAVPAEVTAGVVAPDEGQEAKGEAPGEARGEASGEAGGAGGLRRVRLVWQESGVPLGRNFVPERRGYGRELIERALVYDLQAETTLSFAADGVRCVIEVPLALPTGATD